ncbi:MAG: hypothetical protein HFJ12_05300 [Bacilli bacterium]|nr:hypothetical protein [Bacilli bacterium]
MPSNFLSQVDINQLLGEIDKLSTEKSIIEITPKEIQQISDEKSRKEKQQRFNAVNFLYIRPLFKLLTHFLSQDTNNRYSDQLDDLSILGRIGKIGRRLLQYGCSRDELVNLVPKTKKEVEIILEAKSLGFTDTDLIDNSSRVSQAQNWIQMYGQTNLSNPEKGETTSNKHRR